MTRQAPKRLYFHHLMKCGGTSLNTWIDSHDPWGEGELSAIQKAAYSRYENEPNPTLRDRLRLRAFARDAMAQRSVLYDHAPLATHVPSGTLRFTMLRRPVPRLISHIKDWRRFSESEIHQFLPHKRDAAKRVQAYTIGEFVEYERSGKSPFRFLFDNYMVRAIAENWIGGLAKETQSAALLLPIAMEVLEQGFEQIGILEHEEETRRRLADLMDWVAPSQLPRLNQTIEDSAPATEVEEAAEVLALATEHDERLYAHALGLFEAAV